MEFCLLMHSLIYKHHQFDALSLANLGSDPESETEPFFPDVSEYQPSSDDHSDADSAKQATLECAMENGVVNLEPLYKERELEGMQEMPSLTANPRKRFRRLETWKRNVSKKRR